jgi:hypothetical protein
LLFGSSAPDLNMFKSCAADMSVVKRNLNVFSIYTQPAFLSMC